ncbi:MAG: aminodeoxychorismate synthase component, partial [Jatrophihabitantaceae bacterium]|nr:aminodeoxychorismate synthase component [Jatrophihabitantaceae bacterium]
MTGNGPDALAALNTQPAIDIADSPPGAIGGGYLGGLGYASLDDPPPDPAHPPIRFGFYDHLLRHHGARWTFEMLWTPSRSAALEEALARARELVRAEAPDRRKRAKLTAIRFPDRETHLRAVAAAQDLIARGGMYQANICAELTARLQGHPFELWRQLVQSLGPSHAAYLPTALGLSIGASPELFLRRHGDAATTSPIKGTRPRSTDPALDAASRAELAASSKDRAENVMIVDLMRNDLGRVARTGGVAVSDLLRVTAG